MLTRELLKWIIELALDYSVPADVLSNHADVIKWKHFPRYLPFVRAIIWTNDG